MLAIKNLHAGVDDKNILKGINLEVNPGEIHAIMGPNGAGKSTFASIIAGKEDFEVSQGHILLEGEDLADLDAEERAHKGVFLSFQYPVEIPGVTVTNFIKTAINQTRKAQGLDDMPAGEMLKKIKEVSELLDIDRKFLSRSLNEGFSGGEKKRNEIFQMAMLDPKLAILDETDSGLDIDALKIVANGVNKLRSKDNAVIVITHYQRLLDYIVPDFVHVLMDGKIVKSGSKELALELESKGYDWIKEEVNWFMELKEKFISSFLAVDDFIDSHGPIYDIRKAAIKSFEAKGFPTKKTEAWKYTSLKSLLNNELSIFSVRYVQHVVRWVWI